MKKIYYLIVAAIAMSAVSCDPVDSGKDLVVPEGISIQENATAGSKISIKGSNFAEDAKFYLKSADGKQIDLTVSELLSSGAEVELPYNLGDFTAYVYQAEKEIEIGKIKIAVTDITVPATAGVGSEVVISANGVASDAVIVLVNGDKKYELNATVDGGSVKITLPADIAKGEYSITVKQAETEQALEEKLKVSIAKRMTSFTVWMNVGIMVPYMKYDITYSDAGDPATVVFSMLDEAGLETGEINTIPAYNYTVSKEGNTYSFATETGLPFSLTLEDGKVVSDSDDNKWEYNADGNLTGNGVVSFTWADGNLNMNDMYKYEPAVEYNVDYKVNVMALPQVALLGSDPTVIAVMLGWTGTPSTGLPSGTYGQTEEGDVWVAPGYEYDEDGYLTKYTDKGQGGEFTFTYEAM